MARKLRIFVENTPQHVMLKSINEMDVFIDSSDYEEFLNIVSETSQRHGLKIHSYIVTKNYFEFLATPSDVESLPKLMQSLGRRYVGYFNKKYSRTGTIWEGRYKTSIVESELYLFDVMAYIEKKSNDLNYRYSSLSKNLYDNTDKLVTYHELYKKLGFTQEDRISLYSKIFFAKTEEEKNFFIQSCLEKQTITSSAKFIRNLELLIGMTLSAKKIGRPKIENTQQRKKMYTNLQVLDKEKHKEFKINPLENLNFAKQTAFLPVVANEAALIAATFPVVFTSEENASLVALVSLGGDSLAINSEGKWITSYIPSFLRKYPFSMASTKENADQKVILIDEDSHLFSKSKGKQLFKKDGEKSETLEHAINFLTSHEQQSIVTKNIVNEIVQSGILDDREISVGEGEEKKVLVNGFKVVDREKLNKLSDDILASWVRRGIITFIDAHLKSLENIQTLFNLANQRQS
ncbi:MAG: SapC family protein [Campylobacterales bacterium]|nr:SapC family protein [Campylobacterales bacterium]